jgi:hypothetical protein
MEDPVEINRRIDRLVNRVRRRDDYGKLLARGDVVRLVDDVDDPNSWREGIKRQARADKIKVRTGQTGERLWAYLHGPNPKTQMDENDRYFRLLEAMKTRAHKRGHRLRIIVHDGEEALVKCPRCGALGYGDGEGEGVLGGSALEDDCPSPEPPGEFDAGWL